jgi:hypothetical protein
LAYPLGNSAGGWGFGLFQGGFVHGWGCPMGKGQKMPLGLILGAGGYGLRVEVTGQRIAQVRG